MKRNQVIRLFCFIGVFLLSALLFDLAAQCPMCRMSAESNLAHGGSAGKGLNKGILYMFAMPYLIVTTLAIVWIRNKKEIDEGQI